MQTNHINKISYSKQPELKKISFKPILFVDKKIEPKVSFMQFINNNRKAREALDNTKIEKMLKKLTNRPINEKKGILDLKKNYKHS